VLFVFIWAFCSSLEIHGAEGGVRMQLERGRERERDERIYSEELKVKVERGPLVVARLLCVSVEKKPRVARKEPSSSSVRLQS